MDGLELSKKARELNPNIVILIISAYDDFQYARTAMHLQAFDYILKPIDVDQFCRVLENAVLHCSQLHYVLFSSFSLFFSVSVKTQILVKCFYAYGQFT